MSAADTIINEKKREAVAELNGYREQRRKEREARERANLSAEAEIEAAILARRKDEAEREQIRAASVRRMEEHEAKVAAAREDDRQRRIADNPRLQLAEHPARRVALMLRQALGDRFEPIVAEMRGTNYKQLIIELAKIPGDEAAEAARRRDEDIKARLAEQAYTLPAPDDDAEAEILARHGFTVEKRAAELSAGAL